MRIEQCLRPKRFVLSQVREKIPVLRELLLRRKAQGAYLFGSVLQDLGNSMSDLDIAVLPPWDLKDWLGYYNDLHREICQLFQADNIDLVLLNRAPFTLKARVVLEGLCILCKGSAKAWEEGVLASYVDLAGWRRENWEMTRQLAHGGATGEVNMIDKERVERFVFLIRDAVHELQDLDLERMGLEAFLADKRTRALSEHYLRIAIEATLDLGRHVIVRTGLGVPQEYREVGKILREHGVVPAELGRQLEAMAGMRNVLVHLYRDVDYTLLYKTIMEELDAFQQCIKCIFDYLDKLEANEG